MAPLCTRIYTHPFFEATPPGAAPGPPVNTGARVRHFRGCNNPGHRPRGGRAARRGAGRARVLLFFIFFTPDLVLIILQRGLAQIVYAS